MADDTKFFDEQKAQEDVQSELDKIKVGETEYDPKELEAMVEKSKKIEEFEKKYSTSSEGAWKLYGKTNNENDSLKKELEQLKQQVQSHPQVQTGDLSEEQIAQAREQARKIGIVTQGDLDTWYQSRRAAEKLLEDCSSFEGDITGEDGRPKFNTEEILNHMQETGIKNPMKAYKDKYETELEAWKSSELNKEKSTSLPTMSTPSAKLPKNVPITKDNIGEMIRQQLWGSEKPQE